VSFNQSVIKFNLKIGVKLRYSLVIIFIYSCVGPSTTNDPFNLTYKKPVLLDFGNISTKKFHESINHISSDNNTIYFTRSAKSFKTSTIYFSQFSKGEWSVSRVIPFSGAYYDADLQFSPNEKQVFFTSKRKSTNPELSSEWNIWSVSLDQNNQWTQPEVLPFPINSASQECCLTMNKKGVAYFSSNRDGSWDIYEAIFSNGQFSNVKKLDAMAMINSEEEGEWPSYINDSGNVLLFSSIRSDGRGGDDIYLSRKDASNWTVSILLDSIVNSTKYEDSALISFDQKFFFFSSSRDTEFTTGISNIYYLAIPDFLKNEIKD